MHSPPPTNNTFVLHQPLFHLRYDADANVRWQAALAESEPVDELRQAAGFRDAMTAPDAGRTTVPESAWFRYDRDDLTALLSDPPERWRRVALICRAGLGKTTNLQFLADGINRYANFRGRQYTVVLALADVTLPANKLFERVVEQAAKDAGCSSKLLRADFIRRRREGRITLLFDSLDQAGPDPNGPVMLGLTELLDGPWATCPIWVSGRPHAFVHNKKTFGHGWQLCRVGQLDPPESAFLLDEIRPAKKSTPGELYRTLSPSAKRLAQVPRIARLIGQLPAATVAAKLAGEATAADVYWTVCDFEPAEDGDEVCGLLRDGLKAEGARKLAWRQSAPPEFPTDHQVQRARDLLGAIAFEMLAQRDADDNPAPAFNGVLNAKQLRGEVRKRFLNAGAMIDAAGRPEDAGYFDADWKAVRALDAAGLSHFLFSNDMHDAKLCWSDITLMAFFAAYWAVRWGGPAEQRSMNDWVLDPVLGRNEEFREFWTFAADMPDDAMRPVEGKPPDYSRWVEHVFGPMFTGEYKDAKDPIRCCEFIDFTWERMAKRGPDKVRQFRAPDSPALTDEVLANFLPLVGNPVLVGDTGTFTMGDGQDDDNPAHSVTVTHFCMNTVCVTNRAYELFDPRHKNNRWERGQQRGDDAECPVVNVSWWDARCFARWIDEREIPGTGQRYSIELPTEAQWEYACRAGQTTPFSFAPGHDDETCTPDVCNFDGNRPFPDGTPVGHIPDSIRYRRKTIPVTALPANRWGFFQMHGNCWEWCTDWYLPGFYTTGEGRLLDPVNDDAASYRVLRGGSWIDNGVYCRSAYRNWSWPVYRYQYYGFRLAAVPVGGAK